MHPNNTNRLENETSPYLLQHADNPVDWHPWGPEALDLAREAGKPVLLSIGYSACHWCHVMAHESFEDDKTAALMNELFVNIKVDREERPDLDKLYQTAHQLLAQRPGGWPLTVFLDPADTLPFFAGTYFPSTPRHGMPAFSEVLSRVADFYRGNRDEIRQQKAPLTEVFARIDATDLQEGRLDDTPLRAIRRELEQSFDARHGGFGGAPKFPHPAGIERLLRCHAETTATGDGDRRALHMASFTLESMVRGGIYDQLGGGFYRYSVDAEWRIPHFEKMLYDNGPLLALCAEAWTASGQEIFRRAAIETADWVLREMRHPDGGFYATLDADSEGEEGRFYVWDASEVEKLSGADWSLISACYGLDQPPNFEGRHHLWQTRPLASLAGDAGLDRAEARARVDAVRGRLLDARDTRVRPGRDEKILSGWNGLMIRGLAVASRHLGEDRYTDAAARAVDFVRANLWRDGRLYAAWKDGRARFPAYLDDHAYLLDALLELLQCRWDTARLGFAVELAELLMERFEDRDNGGFYFTADDHESLFHRPRPLADDATPSGNGIAARALQRLGFLLGETRYTDAAERTLRAAWDPMRQQARGHATLIDALAEYLEPPEILVLRGTPDALAKIRKKQLDSTRPRRLCFAIPADADGLPAALATRRPRGELCAYLCRGHTCSTHDDPDELLRNAN